MRSLLDTEIKRQREGRGRRESPKPVPKVPSWPKLGPSRGGRDNILRICNLGDRNQIRLSANRAAFIPRNLPCPLCVYSSHSTSPPTLLTHLRLLATVNNPPRRFVSSSSAAL